MTRLFSAMNFQALKEPLIQRHKLTIFAALLSVSNIALCQEEATVNLSSTVIGNQEQPKVLYIVPWKPVGDSELENQTIQSQLDIVFGHVERVELRRELKYMDKLSKAAKKAEGK